MRNEYKLLGDELMEKEVVIEKILEICGKYTDILIVYLFGSIAKGTANSRSDIDIAFYYSGDTKGEKFLDFYISLNTELSIGLHSDVDLVLLNSATPMVKHRIFNEGIPILIRDENLAKEVRLETVREYDDIQHLFAYQRKKLKERVLGGDK